MKMSQISVIQQDEKKFPTGCLQVGRKRLSDSSPQKSDSKRPALADLTNALTTKKQNMIYKIHENKIEQIQYEDVKRESNLNDTKSHVTRLSQEISSMCDENCCKTDRVSQEYLRSSTLSPCKELLKETSRERVLPYGVEDFDKDCSGDIFAEPTYAMDIFKYYRTREPRFKIDCYMKRQEELSKGMRAVLVDWMVDVQQSFELNHETLYLGVKMVDHYLTKKTVAKASLQLLGITCLLIASKFDERNIPAVDDFLLICDNAYSRKQLFAMELDVFKMLDFDLGIPLSYRFLRRFARCAKLSVEVLTLARYILETSLVEYDMITELDSKMAAASLHLALRMKGNAPVWTSCLEYYSGYQESDLLDLECRLNRMIAQPTYKNVSAVKTKYSHSVFLQVAKIPSLPIDSQS